MPQIATTLAPQPYERLRRLAHLGQVNYATIIERALLAYAPAESPPAPDVQVIQAALGPVLERLAALEGRLSAMEGRGEVGAVMAGSEEREPETLSSTPLKVFADLPPDERAQAVGVMRDMRRRGLSYREIGAAMLEEGVVTASGKALWPGQVRKLLDEQSD